MRGTKGKNNKATKAAPAVRSSTLIAVVTCRKFRARADSQRATWVPEARAKGFDVAFFVGSEGPVEREDEVAVDAPDGYHQLPLKVQEAFIWALSRGYTKVLKVDDDVYLDVERLEAPRDGVDYSGRVRGPSGEKPAPYCSGFCYWVSERAMKCVSSFKWDGDQAEDRWVGNVLLSYGIRPVPDYRFVVAHSDRNCLSGKEGPRDGNDVVAVAELSAVQMEFEHANRRSPATHRAVTRPQGVFGDVDVLVKTFLRDGHMRMTAAQVEAAMPGARLVIIDDGVESKDKVRFYADLRSRGHVCEWLPFDSGFCAKSNRGVELSTRPYLLVASDDFEFTAETARAVARMRDVLAHRPDVGVASGRVDGRPYDGFIDWDFTNMVVREVPLSAAGREWLRTEDGTEYQTCDITVNWSLVRREVFWNRCDVVQYRGVPATDATRLAAGEQRSKVVWDEGYKIGGDHFEFFFQVKEAAWAVAILRDAPVRQRPDAHGLSSPEYGGYRGRAKAALPRFFEKFKLTRYVAFDGREDVLQPDGSVKSVAPPRPPSSPRKRDAGNGRVYVAAERLYLDVTGKVVDGTSPHKHSLLVARGGKLPWSRAVELKLV
jgi:hypothetical protein